MITVGHLVAFSLVLIGAIALALYGIRYRSKTFEVGKFPVFRPLSDEVGRAAEEGALIHIALGDGSLTGDDAMASLAALEGLTALCDLSAAYDTPPIITTGDPTLYILADDWMRRAYVRLGNVQRYRPTLVQYTASNPITYAAMAATYLYEKGIGSNIMLGAFNQEISLIDEAAKRRGISTSAGVVSPQAISALYPALGKNNLAMGEELFFGGADVTGKTAYWASLSVQDLLRWITIGGIIVLAVLQTLGIKVG